jgi:hypothetical protein
MIYMHIEEHLKARAESELMPSFMTKKEVLITKIALFVDAVRGEMENWMLTEAKGQSSTVLAFPFCGLFRI